MIQRHPLRVMLVLVVLAGVLFALGGPGRGDTSGPWMYVSGVAFIAFLLTTATLVVLGLYLLAVRLRTRRSAADR
jgi:hypothetical protein